MNDFSHFLCGERNHCLAGEGDVPVCVTDDTESCHGENRTMAVGGSMLKQSKAGAKR